MKTVKEFWNEVYSGGGQLNRYPYGFVFSMAMRLFRKSVEFGGVSVLEVGCGAANNLIALAREGFEVTGIDFSEEVVNIANQRLSAEGFAETVQVGDFTQVPFGDEKFDIVIDRGAVCCVSHQSAIAAYSEAGRVLRRGGAILGSLYRAPDAIAKDDYECSFRSGDLEGVGYLRFSTLDEVHELANAANCVCEEIREVAIREVVGGKTIPGTWEVVLRRKS